MKFTEFISLLTGKNTSGELSNFRHISAEEAYELLQEDPGKSGLKVIDMRTPAEFQGGAIENAININLYGSDFSDRLNRLDRKKRYLVYCRSGHRSGKALNVLRKMNFDEALNMKGGLIRWNSRGFPIVN